MKQTITLEEMLERMSRAVYAQKPSESNTNKIPTFEERYADLNAIVNQLQAEAQNNNSRRYTKALRGTLDEINQAILHINLQRKDGKLRKAILDPKRDTITEDYINGVTEKLQDYRDNIYSRVFKSKTKEDSRISQRIRDYVDLKGNVPHSIEERLKRIKRFLPRLKDSSLRDLDNIAYVHEAVKNNRYLKNKEDLQEVRDEVLRQLEDYLEAAYKKHSRTLYERAKDSVKEKAEEHKQRKAQWVEEINKDTAQTLYWKGLNFLTSEKYEDALASLEKAIEKDPEFTSAYVDRATALRYLDRLDEAEEGYKVAFEISNNTRDKVYCLMSLAAMAEKEGDISKADGYYKQVLDQSSGLNHFLTKRRVKKRNRAYEEIEKRQERLETYLRAIETHNEGNIEGAGELYSSLARGNDEVAWNASISARLLENVLKEEEALKEKQAA